MAILIEGMEMPEQCIVNGCYYGNCPLDRLWCMQRYAPEGYTMGQAYQDRDGKRPDWCPLRPASEWISVKERLPEECVPVNIVWVNTAPPPYYEVIKNRPFVATGIFKGKWYWYSCVCEDYLREYGEWEPDAVADGIIVTHWMPLPSAPEVPK